MSLDYIDKLYKSRFSEEDIREKNEIWKIFCRYFFQKYIPLDSTVVDIGAGYCEFINNIKCRKKIAVDLSNDNSRYANEDIEFQCCSSTNLGFAEDESIDIVFISNFFEHLKEKDDILKTLKEVHRILRTNGKLLILQPNIRFVKEAYWDFFDHNIALSDISLGEIVRIAEFEILETIRRFIPYSTKLRLPRHRFLVILYLKIPILWNLFGGQTFMVAAKGGAGKKYAQ